MVREIRFEAYVDPDIAMSYKDLSDPFTTRVPIGITNGETIELWFRSALVSPPAGYSAYTTDLGSVAAGASAFKVATFNRARPTARTTDSLTMRIQAFTDSGYTNLYGQKDLSLNYHLFDHTLLTLVDKDDFDDGTLQGWSQSSGGPPGVDGTRYLTAPYSARFDDGSYKLGVIYIAGILKMPYEVQPPIGNWFRLCFFMPVNQASLVELTAVFNREWRYLKKTFTIGAVTRAFIVMHVYLDGAPLTTRANLDEVWVVTE